MTVLMSKKSLWLNCIALSLLLSFDQPGTLINPKAPKQGTVIQEEENLPICFHQAVLQGDVASVRTRLKTININAPGSQRNIALHLDVLQDNLALVKVLVKANVRPENTVGLSPLKEVIDGLITALQDKDKDVRRSAAHALERIKANTPEGTSGLLTDLEDQDSSTYC